MNIHSALPTEAAAPIAAMGEPTPVPPAPAISIASASWDGQSALTVVGKIENAKVPPVFALRTDLGCRRDAKIAATTTGTSFAFAIGETELAESFGCAIDVSIDDESMNEISVAPHVVIDHPSEDVRYESISVTAGALDPEEGEVVRVSLVTPAIAQSAAISFGETTYGAFVAPLEPEEDGGSRVSFDIPARVWARAAIGHTQAHVSVTGADGAHHDLDLAPSARVEILAEEPNEEDEALSQEE